jgi:hypothetical protein
MTVPNQKKNSSASSTNPGIKDQAGIQSFNYAVAPDMIVNRDTAAKIGHGLPLGM